MIPKLARFAVLALTVFCTVFAISQSSLSTGGIQGTVTDPQGAVIPNATVTITNTQTGQVKNFNTTGAGLYNAASLVPGTYRIDVESAGFPKRSREVTVQVGVTSNGDMALSLSASTSVEVSATAIAVDTTQPTVQGVLTPEQINNLPVDGRNFLNLAQLEPGVQLQDGQDFDPTKAGYSSVSFNGVNGRTARIELDGVDVSDETVGTTTLNISSGSIQEFQVARSTLDPSTELTSSGSINVSTKSGTNALHGEVFGLFRDRRAGFAASPGGVTSPFQRSQYGGSLGGPIIKDKLFFFANSERIKQDQTTPVAFAPPFDFITQGFQSPFRDTYSVGRVDAQLFHGIHAFYRFAYEVNSAVANFGSAFQAFANRDNTPAHAAGVDFTTGNFTHSVRWGFEKFHNRIADATAGLSGVLNPIVGANITVGDTGYATGPNLLAPQQTFQQNKQIKYDGSHVWGNHILRYGASYNRIDGGGFASFFGISPEIDTSFGSASGLGLTQAQLQDVNNYPIDDVIIGNGQGFFTEKKAFGFPGGGQADNRFSFYAGDTWKVTKAFTLNYYLRYQRDTGRTDSDLAPLPCSSVDTVNAIDPSFAPCTGSSPLFNNIVQGLNLGKRINQPNANFAPTVGVAWDVTGNGKTVIRAGAGIYYENSIFNNTLFDRPAKLPTGLFFNNAVLCGGTEQINFPNPDGTFTTLTSFNNIPFSTLCSENIGQAAPTLLALQKAYQAAVAAAGPTVNPNFVGENLAIPASFGLSAYAPNYHSPYSYQMNVGIQRELWGGGVFTADYLRNVGLRFPLTIDVNHVGDARFLNLSAAQSAIARTNNSFNCGASTASSAIDCAIAAGATIQDYANFGLDSGNAKFSGLPSTVFGRDPNTRGAAFAGINPLFGQMLFEFPVGRSVYNGLQLNYRQQYKPWVFLKGGNLEASYAFSRFNSNGGNDQNFSATAFDFRNATRYFGPTALDRTHQFSIGGVFDFKYGPRLSFISHFYSPQPNTLQMDRLFGVSRGEIFRSDFTGDGTIRDILTGSNIGSFERGISTSGLAQFVNNFNSKVAGQLTPAGQALVQAGLFTPTQLASLQAVIPQLNAIPAHNLGNSVLKTLDLRASYVFHVISERFQIEPSVGFFNLPNFANFGRYTNGFLEPVGRTPATGSIGGSSTAEDKVGLRTGNGSGTFSQGAPRQIEFGLRITF